MIDQERYDEARERGKLDEDEWKILDILTARLTDLKGLASRIGMALRGVEIEPKLPRNEGEEGLEEVENVDTIEPEDLAEASAEDDPFASEKWFIKPE